MSALSAAAYLSRKLHGAVLGLGLGLGLGLLPSLFCMDTW